MRRQLTHFGECERSTGVLRAQIFRFCAHQRRRREPRMAAQIGGYTYVFSLWTGDATWAASLGIVGGSPLVLLARRHLEPHCRHDYCADGISGGARYLEGAVPEETGPRAGRTESHAASFEFRRTAASSSAVGGTFQAVQPLRSLAFGSSWASSSISRPDSASLGWAASRPSSAMRA